MAARARVPSNAHTFHPRGQPNCSRSIYNCNRLVPTGPESGALLPRPDPTVFIYQTPNGYETRTTCSIQAKAAVLAVSNPP